MAYLLQKLRYSQSGREDGLNNDFYKDMSALVVPALIIISNEILNEPSFLVTLMIPLRKKGDSDDAMDYLSTNLFTMN